MYIAEKLLYEDKEEMGIKLTTIKKIERKNERIKPTLGILELNRSCQVKKVKF